MLFLRWLCGGVTRGVLMSALKVIGSPGGQGERLRGRGGAKWLCFTFFTLNASPPVLYFISNLYVGVLWLTVPNWFLQDCTVRKEHLDLVQRSMLTHDIWCFCPLLEYSIRWENCSIKKHCSTFARPYVVRVVFYSGIKNQNTAYLNKCQLASIAHFFVQFSDSTFKLACITWGLQIPFAVFCLNADQKNTVCSWALFLASSTDCKKKISSFKALPQILYPTFFFLLSLQQGHSVTSSSSRKCSFVSS